MEATVFVIDDDDSVLRSLERLLRAAGYRVVTFPSAQAFLAHGNNIADAGCIILDVQMPSMTGLDLQDWLNTVGSYHPPVIFLTGHGTVLTSVRALKRGAQDFLEKPVNADDLLAAVQQALASDSQKRQQQEELHAIRANLATLTARERDVLMGVIAGSLNKQIAWDLGISEKTVKVHRGHVMEKMQVKSVAELVSQMLKMGITPPTDNAGHHTDNL